MGTELVRPCVKEENLEIPSIPPGFESLTSFTLKRVEDNESKASCSISASASELQTAKMEMELEYGEDAKMKRSLRHRPWINYGRYDNSSGDESDNEQVDQFLFFCFYVPIRSSLFLFGTSRIKTPVSILGHN